MKCKYCGNTLEFVYVCETFIKHIGDVCDEQDFFENYDGYEESTIHCPQCNAYLDEEELVEAIIGE